MLPQCGSPSLLGRGLRAFSEPRRALCVVEVVVLEVDITFADGDSASMKMLREEGPKACRKPLGPGAEAIPEVRA